MQHGYRYTPSDPNVTLENNKRVKNYYREELSAFTNTNAHYLFLFLMSSKADQTLARLQWEGVTQWWWQWWRTLAAAATVHHPLLAHDEGQFKSFQCV